MTRKRPRKKLYFDVAIQEIENGFLVEEGYELGSQTFCLSLRGAVDLAKKKFAQLLLEHGEDK